MSRGSLQEIRDHLSVALDCNYLDEKEFRELDSLTVSCLRLTNGYINFLIRQKNPCNKPFSEIQCGFLTGNHKSPFPKNPLIQLTNS